MVLLVSQVVLDVKQKQMTTSSARRLELDEATTRKANQESCAELTLRHH